MVLPSPSPYACFSGIGGHGPLAPGPLATPLLQVSQNCYRLHNNMKVSEIQGDTLHSNLHTTLESVPT